MVTDVSGSMNATDVQPDRLTAATDAAKTLTEKVPPTFRLGLITFSDFAEQRVAPTTDRAQIKGALDQLVAEGGTAMGDGLERGLLSARTPVPNADGHRRAPPPERDRPALRRQEHVAARATRSRSPARPAAPASRSTRSRSARRPARSSCATRSASCSASRSRRTPRRSRRSRASPAASPTPPPRPTRSRRSTPTSAPACRSRSEKREVTAFFAGGAIALLIAAGSLSLRWFGRLI